MLVGEPARPADRPAMDREMRRDDPAGPQGPPPDLRDLLSRRHRATAPAGFRPHALDQRLLGAGGAIPESLPLSFVLVLTPGGFAIQKPPASAEEMTGPAPSLKDALEAAGTMLHPYDRSSRSLLQAVDAGRMPSGLLDGIPLKYVDGAALCEVRDYRDRSERRVAAACRRYVAVLHPTAATVAADAEELCAQLPRRAGHGAGTGPGWPAWTTRSGRGATHRSLSSRRRGSLRIRLSRARPREGRRGRRGRGRRRRRGRGTSRGASARRTRRRARRRSCAGGSRSRARSSRRRPALCLDPDPAVAASRRQDCGERGARRAAAAATLCWPRRTRPPFRVPGGGRAPDGPAAAREWRRRRRWLAEPAELQPPLGPDSGFEWYERRATTRGRARGRGCRGCRGCRHRRRRRGRGRATATSRNRRPWIR